MDIYQRVGKRMQDARKHKGMRQSEVADMLGVTAATLSRWETGLRAPTLEAIEQYAMIVHVPLATFFEDYPSSGDYVVDLIAATSKLTPEGQVSVLNYARFLMGLP